MQGERWLQWSRGFYSLDENPSFWESTAKNLFTLYVCRGGLGCNSMDDVEFLSSAVAEHLKGSPHGPYPACIPLEDSGNLFLNYFKRGS